MNADKQQKIERLMVLAKCSRADALAYLEAEEWCVSDALVSFKGDRREAR
jgi:hypothetical protein